MGESTVLKQILFNYIFVELLMYFIPLTKCTYNVYHVFKQFVIFSMY